MATRLSFKYIRTGKLTQYGRVKIDVNDPTDANEISEALQNERFIERLSLAEELDGSQVMYQPDEDDS